MGCIEVSIVRCLGIHQHFQTKQVLSTKEDGVNDKLTPLYFLTPSILIAVMLCIIDIGMFLALSTLFVK